MDKHIERILSLIEKKEITAEEGATLIRALPSDNPFDYTPIYPNPFPIITYLNRGTTG